MARDDLPNELEDTTTDYDNLNHDMMEANTALIMIGMVDTGMSITDSNEVDAAVNVIEEDVTKELEDTTEMTEMYLDVVEETVETNDKEDEEVEAVLASFTANSALRKLLVWNLLKARLHKITVFKIFKMILLVILTANIISAQIQVRGEALNIDRRWMNPF
jgi:hypothetical protein